MKKLTTSVTKILDLSITEIGNNFINQVSGFESYDDRNFPSESLYSIHDIMNRVENGIIEFDRENLYLLDQIFDLCAKKDCAYFRIIQ